MKRIQHTLILCLSLLILTACTSGGQATLIPEAALTNGIFEIKSEAFEMGQPVPVVYTCQSDDISPELHWSSPPQGTKSLVLIMNDPDAPFNTWTHWILYNLPPSSGSLPQGVAETELPQDTLQGLNSWKNTGYGGPCPPSGVHRYVFTLYALDITLEEDGLKVKDLQTAMDGHVLTAAVLQGTFGEE